MSTSPAGGDGATGPAAGGPLTFRPAPRRRFLGRVVLGAFVAGVVGLGGPWLWVTLAARGRLHTPDDVPHQRVALVLGAGVLADGTPSPFLAARLDLARELLADGKVAVLLVSGDNRTDSYDEPTAMKRYLVAAGVPEERIVTDHAGRDTYDSCARARRIFGLDRVTVVSQSYHVPRAVAICSALGVESVGVGDETVRRWPAAWREGVLREVFANVKAVADVVTRRDPVLGPAEPGVRDAVRAHAAGP